MSCSDTHGPNDVAGVEESLRQSCWTVTHGGSAAYVLILDEYAAFGVILEDCLCEFW